MMTGTEGGHLGEEDGAVGWVGGCGSVGYEDLETGSGGLRGQHIDEDPCLRPRRGCRELPYGRLQLGRGAMLLGDGEGEQLLRLVDGYAGCRVCGVVA